MTSDRIYGIVADWQTHGVASATIDRRLSPLRRAFRLKKPRPDVARLDEPERFVEEASPRRQIGATKGLFGQRLR